MEKETIEHQYMTLFNVRLSLLHRLRNESDTQIRAALFEARKAIGFAMLHLEEVDFCLNRVGGWQGEEGNG